MSFKKIIILFIVLYASCAFAQQDLSKVEIKTIHAKFASPGHSDRRDANKFIDIPIATGLGYTRNTLVTTASDIIIALEGRYGTLSEIGFALNAKKPVIGSLNGLPAHIRRATYPGDDFKSIFLG